MNRIAEAFRGKKAFIPYIPCGDPDIGTSEEIARQAVTAGADLIELGIPFSDPTAEGPVLQESMERALVSGTTTDDVLDMAKRLRRDIDIPLVIMTYANVVFSYGGERFMKRCRDCGIDGLILPDLPYEERGEFADEAKKYGIALISLIAPTSAGRIAIIAKEAEGFIYIVSSLGVTGERTEIKTDLDQIVRIVRENTDIPCAIGFGISTPAQAAAMCAIADGAIVGSAIARTIATAGSAAPAAVAEYVRTMKKAISDL